jgi:hypothetical protein
VQALNLEEYEHAIKRGAKIMPNWWGGLSCDAYHMTAPDPEGEGAMLAMKWLAKMPIAVYCIDYINVHGTSTGLGDIAEPKQSKNFWRTCLQIKHQFNQIDDRPHVGRCWCRRSNCFHSGNKRKDHSSNNQSILNAILKLTQNSISRSM